MDASEVKVLRGRVLSFVDEPQAIDDAKSYRYIEDGAVVIGGGKIILKGEFNPKAAAHHEVIDHRGKLILAGLIDPHIHFPQMQVIGSYAANLLEWLNTYTFVEEQRFADAAHATRIAGRFFDELIRHGTTTAAAYCTIHPASVDAFCTARAARPSPARALSVPRSLAGNRASCARMCAPTEDARTHVRTNGRRARTWVRRDDTRRQLRVNGYARVFGRIASFQISCVHREPEFRGFD